MLAPLYLLCLIWREKEKGGGGVGGLADIFTIGAVIESCVAVDLDEIEVSARGLIENFTQVERQVGVMQKKRELIKGKWKVGNGGRKELEKRRICFTGKSYVPHLPHLMKTKSQPELIERPL